MLNIILSHGYLSIHDAFNPEMPKAELEEGIN